LTSLSPLLATHYPATRPTNCSLSQGRRRVSRAVSRFKAT
jgi:hypothetical protein